MPRAAMPPADRVAVTMTGELCDCFRTKREGVESILDATLEVWPGRKVCVWGTDGAFHWHRGRRRDRPELAAASNWLALATLAGASSRASRPS